MWQMQIVENLATVKEAVKKKKKSLLIVPYLCVLYCREATADIVVQFWTLLWIQTDQSAGRKQTEGEETDRKTKKKEGERAC